MRISRRLMLGLCGALAWRFADRGAFAESSQAYPIGACDWSLGACQTPRAFEVAKEIGLDGVQVSFGAPGEEFDLRKPEVRQQYEEAAQQTGVKIASLAMGILNNVPFASDPRTEEWVSDCIDVMAAMGQKIVLLAFFGKGDIRNRPDLQAEVIRRLKRLAPKAEKAGVVLGIESMLNVDDHLKILDAVGSPAVQVYYDVANMHYAGYDIFEELRRLGRERICQVHTKEYDHLIGQGPIDFRKVRDVLEEIGYKDWLILEAATVKGRPIVDCYRENARYLRSLFHTSRAAS
ncbi:sugar phosphate isomerase/epimerase family protein [Thermogutta sp.]|jgi:sugar phosphate isomerase/epimerase|uniref:sugar phosphate isomerase/epimerase family protein n=1 Tax=Thermogutta sp. TaxID=1962930 RepID=UPI003C7E9E1D